ncbi:NrfD/PsrC family molybdoenzyme membrane anchor subunit [Methylocystis bryophila]|uniref:Hydrogenase n=1 Tax=Methylocystis bryophila TaxID=655015 RepID=A0A1W6N085_9HYPH|nr:NrfD/PsrC family molybdoenzyme membrane anchor subunit [Methylocystis bryophila]ARN83240.1 hydrogenase [Methylocystis bryophila]BDV39582.1 polysulfide reductase NrfD [Methylocystis bryophila]
MTAPPNIPTANERWVLPQARSYEAMTELVSAPLLECDEWSWRGWWIAFAISLALTAMMLLSASWLLERGVGVWGVNTTIVWGFAIANYVWWIGIGNAGTLISAMLLLMRQHWRASINRFAEAMTLFAAGIAGLFPILHLGRPLYFYWLAPYPNTMAIWPQWRSALIWDFWAILSYILFSILFWYVGLIPDLACLRDRATNPKFRARFGAFALGWRGSARHWRLYHIYHTTMACLGVPLVVSLHSVVGLDFAASLMPGWSETIFPPYFVVGAMYSGFAMVVILAAAVRWGFGLQSLITINHFDVMAKILLAASMIMTVSYLTEWFAAWYGGDHSERRLVLYEFLGDYRILYYAMLLCNCVVAHAFWFKPIRRSIALVVTVAILINIGMWLERITIVWNTLSHGYAVSMWRVFHPTIWDYSLMFGSLGLFSLLFLLLCRVAPVVSMHETRRLLISETEP